MVDIETLVESMCLHLRVSTRNRWLIFKQVIESKVDPMTDADYHWPSVASYSKYISYFTGLKLNTMGEFQILLGVILGW